MDVKYINPFMDAFASIMPQLGFSGTRIGNLSAKAKEVKRTGVLVILGIVGDVKGNVVYAMDVDVAKNIASVMMMGMPVEEFDEMAQSAISELTNMITATASTFFADAGIHVDISTPTLLLGENMSVKMNSDQILCVTLYADDIPIEVNISFEN